MNALIPVLGFAALIAAGKDALGNEILVRSDAWTRWDALFKKYGRQEGVSPALLKAICWVESDLGRDESVAKGIANPGDLVASVSQDKKSWGLMQITVDTANRSRVRPGTVAKDLNNPELSVMMGAKILRELKQYYFPTEPDSVIRAYNGGPGFKTTVAGQRDTPAYLAKVKAKLAIVLEKQPELA